MFNWGLIGGGWISSKFAKGVSVTDDMCVYALASASGRNPYGIEPQITYSTYDELLADEKVDAVYIGLLNNLHYPVIKQCILAGKPVLCEKPITINAREFEDLTVIAKEKNVFLMEAMWTRFLPASKYLRDVLMNERYGKTGQISVHFGNSKKMTIPRLESNEMGGGALLDLGVYCISLADYWLGDNVAKLEAAWGNITDEKIDTVSGAVLTYERGAVVDMCCSFQKNFTNDAYIVTDEAEFRIPYFWKPIKIQRYDRKRDFLDSDPAEILDFSFEENGYQFEAWEVKKCVEAGLLESPDMSWEDSLKVMKMMDEIRSRIGVVYSQDAK